MKKATLVAMRDSLPIHLNKIEPSSISDSNLADWTYDSVKSMMELLRLADPETYQHCLRVGEFCRKLARDLGLNEFQQKSAHFAGMLHDIGKIGIDSEILHKPSRLTAAEYDIMKSHSCLSEEIIQPLGRLNKFIELLTNGVRGHHERMDGSGYPDHLVGEAIPLYSRIISVSDTYDAMKNSRVYRRGLDNESIYTELKRCAGTQFDFQIVKTFLEAHPTWDVVNDIDLEVQAKIVHSDRTSSFKKAA